MRKVFAAWIVAGALVAVPSARQNAPAGPADLTALIKQAFRSAYNMDETEPLDSARRAVTLAPADPAAHRALASILWLDILFRRGAVVTDNYLTGSLKEQLALPKPPADLDAEF